MSEKSSGIVTAFKVLVVAVFTGFGIALAPMLGYLIGIGFGRGLLPENKVGYAFLAVAGATALGGFLLGLYVVSGPPAKRP